MISSILLSQLHLFEIKTTGKVGDVYETVVNTQMSSDQGSIDLVAHMKEELTKVQSGKFTWMTTNKMTASGMGSYANAGGDESEFDVTFIRDSRERILAGKIGDMEMGPKLFEDSATMVTPEGKIAVGFSWQQTIAISGIRAKVEYTFLGTEKVQDIPAYKFQFATLKHDRIKTTKTGLMYLDTKTGRLLYAKASYEADIQGVTMSIDYVLKRTKGPGGIQLK